jgi:hypothetical protein
MVHEPGRPVVWIEDEADYGGAYDQLMPYAKENGTPFFAVKPTMSDGLTEAHMLRVRAFFSALRAAKDQTRVSAAATTATVTASSTMRPV